MFEGVKDFKDCEVGDAVWSMCHGWGKVNGIGSTSDLFSVCVLFTDGHSTAYTVEGRDYRHNKNTLFWDEVKITPPPKPKKEVTVEGWMNLYPNTTVCEPIVARVKYVYDTEEAADKYAEDNRLGEAVHIKHKYRE